MSFLDRLRNQVVIERRSVTANATGEEVESWSDTATIRASVQDRTPTELIQPDVDGPVIINAVVFTDYPDGTAIRHLDILRQVDIDPPRRYQVIYPKDAAGIKHHWEHQCQRLVGLEAGAAS